MLRSLGTSGLRNRKTLPMNLSGEILLVARDRKILSHDGPRESLMDRHVAAADVIEYAQRIGRAMLDLGITVDRRAAHEVEVRVERRKHDRDRIVGSGVDVEDKLAGHVRSAKGRFIRRV